MEIFLILFDVLVLVAITSLFLIALSTKKNLRQFKDSYLSLKELSENFDRLIDKCEVEGGKLLDQIEREKASITELLDKALEKKSSNKLYKTTEIPKLEVPSSFSYQDESEEPTSLQDHLKGKYKDIYRLADEGNTLKQIEELLSLPIGEIELILSLRK
jgi:hypothetical protein